MRLLLALCVLSLAGDLLAQPRCGPNGCPQPFLLPAVIAPKVEVVHRDGDAATLWRFRVDGREIGTFDESTGTFTAADGSKYSFRLPAAETSFGQAVPTGGIEPGHLDPGGGESFTLNGTRVNRQAAFESLLSKSGADLLDDSGYLRLTVIGSDEQRKRVLEDLRLNPALTAISGGVLVRDYSPSHWSVKDAGFKIDGSPTIYIQAPTGQVLHRQDDYAGGPERLAGAIRKARPDYDPKKDPDLTKPKIEPALPAEPPAPGPASPAPMKVDLVWIVLIGGIGMYLAWQYLPKPRPVAAAV